MKAVNIQWDTDGDQELFGNLPKEIQIPNGVTDEDDISDYITELTGFCHFGFELEQEFNVTFTQTHTYTVTANSDDEAIDAALALFRRDMTKPIARTWYDDVEVDATGK